MTTNLSVATDHDGDYAAMMQNRGGDIDGRKLLQRWEWRGDVRFVTFSCYRRLPLLKNPLIADLFVDVMIRARDEHAFELYAWVVMPEHVHLLIRPAEGTTWETIAVGWKTSVARQVLTRWRKLQAPILQRLLAENGDTHFWQLGGGFDRNARNITEFTKAVQYIHRNPVKRGLVATAAEWRWSSVRWWMGEMNDEVACDPPPGDPKTWEVWKGYV